MTNMETQWTIQYTAKAREDLKDIVTYIAEELGAHETASSMFSTLTKGVRSLETMPYRFPVYHEEPWTSKGLRVMKVKNYLIFYVPTEESLTVNIVRIIYGGRDIRKQLSATE